MDSSFLAGKEIVTLYSEEDIREAVGKAATQIVDKYLPILRQEGDAFQLVFVAVLSGAIRFRTALANEVGLRFAQAGCLGYIKEDEVSVSSYGEGEILALSHEEDEASTPGYFDREEPEPQEIRFLLDTKRPIVGTHVILVEDIIDTGRTASFIIALLRAKKPIDLDLYVLIDKTPRREKAIQPAYVGFNLTDNFFVVGFGLDKWGRFRELPFVGYIPK